MTDNNVINFPRIGFNLAPPDPGTEPVAPSPATSETAPDATAAGERRSPLDIVSALPSPGILQPVRPAPGHVPDTFRGDLGDEDEAVGPRLGALSLAACLAVAVAALHGTHSAFQDWRQRRLARAEENAPLREARLKHELAMTEAGYARQQAAAKHDAAQAAAAGKHELAMASARDKAAQQHAKQVPSSKEFGSKALSGRGSKTSQTSGTGSGAGRGGANKGTGPQHKPTGPSSKAGPTGPKSKGPTPSPRGNTGSGRGGGSTTPTPKPTKGPKAPNTGPKPKGTGSDSRGGQGGTQRSGGGLGGVLRRSGGGTPKPGDKNSGGKKGPQPKAPHRTSQGGSTLGKTHQSKGKGGSTAAGGGKSTGSNGKPSAGGGRTKAPTSAAGPKGNLRSQKNKGGRGMGSSAPSGSGSSHRKTPQPTPKKNGAGRTTLTEAMKKNAQKAAARRWKRRQSADKTKPPIWAADQKNKKGNGTSGSAAGASPKGPGKQNGTKATSSKGNTSPNAKKGTTATRAGRTTLGQALKKDAQKAAARRWKRRQKRTGTTPPIWTAPKHTKTKAPKGPTSKTQGVTGPKNKNQGGPSTTPGSTPKGGTGGSGRSANTPKSAGTTPPTSTGGKKTKTGPGARGGDHWDKLHRRARERWNQRRSQWPHGGPFTAPTTEDPFDDGGDFWIGDQDYSDFGRSGEYYASRGRRRTPWENAGAATGEATVTVERADHVGAQARRWDPAGLTRGVAGLPPAPTAHTPRPGTTRPRPTPPAPIPTSTPASARSHPVTAALPAPAGGRQMDAQHETEITLDDSLEVLQQLTADGFTAHDESSRLAVKARQLRDTLEDFAEDLAINHNLIGPLFSGAMSRLAESMDLIARMAEEMQISSLHAAESAEAADTDLNDAYRPITQATADAGLTTPSAPIHNRD